MHPRSDGRRRASTSSRVGPVLALFLGACVVGFALVFTFYRLAPVGDALPLRRWPSRDAGARDAGTDAAQPVVDASPGSLAEADAPPEVPPGRTPDGVWLHGKPKYIKCWDAEGHVYAGGSCDSLRLLEKRISSRLYVVDRCKRQHSGQGAQGELSLGAQVDFGHRSGSFWSGPSSTVAQAKQIGTCVRHSLRGLPIHGIAHKFERYNLFFTVEFRNPKKLKAQLEKKRRKGKPVEVTKDRVRVRQAPVDGYIIGKVSTGQQVTLLLRNDEWCHVITQRNREGWMICNALSL